VGQAQRRATGAPQMAGREAFVLKGTQTVAQTKCNRFGEFQFELETEEDEGFSVVLKDPASVVIPLRGIGLLEGGSSKS
jgi:hypothetical protein